MAGYIGSKASVVSSGAERKKVFNITGATTSLTGCNYTVGKVQVFQNGVRLLDGTDYTATDGTTVTLTVAAQSGDNVVVLSFASYQVALSGIDDQSNATALTIDSNENILIGKTATGGNVAGMQIINGSFFSHVRDGGVVQVLNRKSSDGDILSFEKDNTTVGSIGTDSNGDFVIDGSANHSGLRFKDNTVVPKQNGSDADNAIDLGKSDKRWKDLYLSGGVYLGGTGSANKLEDYEEGTWTPAFAYMTGTSGRSYSGIYRKVGSLVYVSVVISSGSATMGSTQNSTRITNLPFTVNSTSSIAFHTNYIETLGTGSIYSSSTMYLPTFSVLSYKSVFASGVYTTN